VEGQTRRRNELTCVVSWNTTLDSCWCAEGAEVDALPRPPPSPPRSRGTLSASAASKKLMVKAGEGRVGLCTPRERSPHTPREVTEYTEYRVLRARHFRFCDTDDERRSCYPVKQVPRIASLDPCTYTCLCGRPHRAGTLGADPVDAPRMLDEGSVRVSCKHASTTQTAHNHNSVCLTLMAAVGAQGQIGEDATRALGPVLSIRYSPLSTLPQGDPCCSSCTKPTLPALTDALAGTECAWPAAGVSTMAAPTPASSKRYSLDQSVSMVSTSRRLHDAGELYKEVEVFETQTYHWVSWIAQPVPPHPFVAQSLDTGSSVSDASQGFGGGKCCCLTEAAIELSGV
jgi:hypothetical protein